MMETSVWTFLIGGAFFVVILALIVAFIWGALNQRDSGVARRFWETFNLGFSAIFRVSPSSEKQETNRGEPMNIEPKNLPNPGGASSNPEPVRRIVFSSENSSPSPDQITNLDEIDFLAFDAFMPGSKKMSKNITALGIDIAFASSQFELREAISNKVNNIDQALLLALIVWGNPNDVPTRNPAARDDRVSKLLKIIAQIYEGSLDEAVISEAVKKFEKHQNITIRNREILFDYLLSRRK